MYLCIYVKYIYIYLYKYININNNINIIIFSTLCILYQTWYVNTQKINLLERYVRMLRKEM